ncbi:unnamed protein product [Symbiodinium natans]|uniref:Uncharacterized protein n=1 Tax=Symbiodinium natans TaxID=878477 RepID=A0A812RXY6_9DINO|nr:unnamed protein product [Symbiodinium natans]
MPNAFQDLSDDTYGPQFLHNAVVISASVKTAQRIASLLASCRGERSMGVAAAVCSTEQAGEHAEHTEHAETEGHNVIEAQDLEDLDPEDFDIVIYVGPHGIDAMLEAAWTSKGIFRRWEESKEEEQTKELLTKLDDVAMRSACGAGTSC